MPDTKIIITREDLNSRRVENRLREQQAMARNRLYASLQEDALPVAKPTRTNIWQHSAVMMTVFGLVGGLLAWSAGLGLNAALARGAGRAIGYDPGARAQSAALVQALHNIDAERVLGQYTAQQADFAADQVRRAGRGNPYFVLATDVNHSDAQRSVLEQELEAKDQRAAFLIDVLQYGLCGMAIALCLAIAEPITQRKLRPALYSGAAGALLGLVGGIAAALLAGRITGLAGDAVAGRSAWMKQLAAPVAAWGALGLFLGLASGLVTWNWKKLAIGLFGGLLGGAIGGALLHPLANLAHNPLAGRLGAMIAIGMIAGAAIGLIETAAKSGWLKVTTGIIAGKQFILYRNPTYIGSAPDCQIYLFKDPRVGKRHAAIHLAPAGIEIEDLPLGDATFVNGKPITRAALKHGDRVAIGATQFLFQERRPK